MAKALDVFSYISSTGSLRPVDVECKPNMKLAYYVRPQG